MGFRSTKKQHSLCPVGNDFSQQGSKVHQEVEEKLFCYLWFSGFPMSNGASGT